MRELGALPGAASTGSGFGPLEDAFVRLIDVDALGVGFVLVAIAVAVGIGAVHALAPGHGKAIIAAYLVGARSRPVDALALGATVAAMHSLSVIVLGLVLFSFTQVPAAGQRAGPWMTVASGLLIVALGAGLATRQLHRRRHGHTHTHLLPEGVSPLSRRGVLLLGMAGGLLPSPSAFLVLGTAIVTGRTLFGLSLVLAFSVGLAATLTVIGLAALRGRDVLARLSSRSPRTARLAGLVPTTSAVLILAGGIYLTTVGVWQL